MGNKTFIKPEIFVGLAERERFESVPKSRVLERSWQVIENVVSDYYGMKVSDLRNRCRKREYVTLRQMCWVFMHECSLRLSNQKRVSQIGLRHGFDHASVIHGKRRMKDLTEYDKDMKSQYDELHRLLTFVHNLKI